MLKNNAISVVSKAVPNNAVTADRSPDAAWSTSCCASRGGGCVVYFPGGKKKIRCIVCFASRRRKVALYFARCMLFGEQAENEFW